MRNWNIVIKWYYVQLRLYGSILLQIPNFRVHLRFFLNMCALLENLFSRCLNALYLERFRMLTPFRKRVSWFFARHSSDAKMSENCYRVSSPEIDVKLWRLKPKWPYNCCCRKPSVQIKLVSSMNGVYFSLQTLKLLPGEWSLIPEMIQVCDQYILIILDGLNTLIYSLPLWLI